MPKVHPKNNDVLNNNYTKIIITTNIKILKFHGKGQNSKQQYNKPKCRA
jgi:hypothetical protein